MAPIVKWIGLAATMILPLALVTALVIRMDVREHRIRRAPRSR
jgi:hypothetical protein